MKGIILFWLISIHCTFCSAQLFQVLDSPELSVDVVIDSGRVNAPWDMTWGLNITLWLTDVNRILRYQLDSDELDTMVTMFNGNGLGLTLHPNFQDTSFVFAVIDTGQYYANGNLCDVYRFRYDSMQDSLVDKLKLFSYIHYGEHAGGRLIFKNTVNNS